MADKGFYRVRLVQQRTNGEVMWTAEHPTLLGCHVVRKDPQEAIDDLQAVREEWIHRALAAGQTVPKPESNLRYELVLAPDHTPEEADSAQRAIHCLNQDSVKTAFSPTLDFSAR